MARRRMESGYDAYDTYGALAFRRDAREEEQEIPVYDERAGRRAAAPRTRRRPLLVVLSLAVLFVAAFTVIIRQIDIQRQIVQLDRLRTELRDEQNREEDLRLELAMAMDIDRVKVAAEDMGMGFPDVENTQKVSLPPIRTGSTPEMAAARVATPEEEQSLMDWLRRIGEDLAGE